VLHPETGKPMTLEDHRSRLLDPSGLDQTSASLLNAIHSENILCFHLLEECRTDIHTSWHKRPEIAKRIKALVPIVHNSSTSSSSPLLSSSVGLFHSAVDDQDKESFRLMVDGLGCRITSCLTVNVGAFHVAVDIVHDLLHLESIVKDPFVTTVVMDMIHQTIVHSNVPVILGVVEDSDDLKPCEMRFESARHELLRVALYLFTFSGIEFLCVALSTLLVNGMNTLEYHMKELEEKRGREMAEERIRNVARESGEDIVKENLLLPKEWNIMKKMHKKEQNLLNENNMNMNIEMHSTKLRRLNYFDNAANDTFVEHSELIRTRLHDYDQLLLKKRKSLLVKVGGARLFEEKKTLLDWNRKEIDEEDCEVIGAVLRIDQTQQTQQHSDAVLRIFLSGNVIGHRGLSSLCHSVAFGAFRNVERLHAQHNHIGDDGFGTLSVQIGDGFFSNLMLLDLGRNAISDGSLISFADMLKCSYENGNGKESGSGSSVLLQLTTLYLSSNKISQVGAIHFAEVLTSTDSAAALLPRLKILWLNRNDIDESGVDAVRNALDKGALPSLEQLMFQGNPASAAMQQKATETLRVRNSTRVDNSVVIESESKVADQYASMRGL
jgi:hypothetical protein